MPSLLCHAAFGSPHLSWDCPLCPESLHLKTREACFSARAAWRRARGPNEEVTKDPKEWHHCGCWGPEGLSKAVGSRGLWPGKGHRHCESAKSLPLPPAHMPAPASKTGAGVCWEAQETLRPAEPEAPTSSLSEPSPRWDSPREGRTCPRSYSNLIGIPGITPWALQPPDMTPQTDDRMGTP